jgi:hypothetical protein
LFLNWTRQQDLSLSSRSSKSKTDFAEVGMNAEEGADADAGPSDEERKERSDDDDDDDDTISAGFSSDNGRGEDRCFFC